MIDFIEYVVAELKSKRLSKTDAAGLVRQFSLRPPVAGAAAIHPLLQKNTSDLNGQRYATTFSGGEFFLADHRVGERKVLPGVAYLEMARAAVQDALAETPAGTLLELRNTIWAQPIVVDGSKEVGIALLVAGDEEIDYEVFSDDVVHCQGRARFAHSAPARLALDELRARMTRGALETERVYASYAQMGLVYGPSFQAITSILRGEGEVLAQLRLPETVASDYVLHPSLLDGALQSALGLIDGETTEPRLPFALETLRLVSPCTREMVAWVRYAADSGENVIKLDVDLCDESGNVCVQMHGFSCRTIAEEARPVVAAPVAVVAASEPGDLAAKAEDYLRRQLSDLLKMPAQKIDPRAALENYGIDSMLAMKLTSQLEKSFGSLPKTLFFEYRTIRDLAGYFLADHAATLSAILGSTATAPAAVAAVPAPQQRVSSRRFSRPRNGGGRSAPDADPIAIVGLSGRYPEAVDLAAYWENLRDGRDCITEVPKERWDWREYLSDDRTRNGHHYSKWGGFISGVDEFDPLFFNISPREAELLDPQERLFLQHAWMAIEDAGYTRAALQTPSNGDLPGQVGVYAGVMYNEYQLFGAEASARGNRMGVPGSMASIANRVSYALNLHGPSMTLDTMCSSSLTAIHLACQDLKLGRTSMAIAGGVNVTVHPNKYLVLSGGQFISSDGHCQSFGEGGDGYIPGEGVGVVVLKRLADAERDGDRIYGIIRGSALTHGGKTNGYSVPNPQAQSSAISRALIESSVDPRHISYIEAHGTGTKLGDPIEIAALTKAFGTNETGFCLIGSAKSNIGHCESAAGIAGLTKVLLQMQHRQIVPSLHSAQLNPHIDFDRTPFVVNQTLRPWEQPVVDGRTLPRIAGLSSFGAGGSNAHLIVEEYVAPEAAAAASGEPVAIVLSARTDEQLREKAQDLLAFARRGGFDLRAAACTLQTGREAMDERIGFIVRSPEELVEKLAAYVAGERSIDDFAQGQVKRNSDALSLFSDSDLQLTIDRWIAGGKLSRIVDAWVRGVEVDWTRLYTDRPRRVSLPAYPFARERYWIDVTAGLSVPVVGAAASVLHPLLHRNTSDLTEQRYSSTFSGGEFFLADHQVASHKVLPGVAYLEMARAAIAQALPSSGATTLELHNTVWAQPVVVDAPRQVSIALIANDDDQIDYEIYSEDGEQDVVHCQGSAIFRAHSAPAAIDVDALRSQLTNVVAGEALYDLCARMGLAYGPSFRGVTAVRRGDGQVLAELRLPAGVAEDFVLHPALMDGALQAAIALMQSESAQPPLPFALETLRVFSPCTREMTAWVRVAAGSGENVIKLDVDLCDARGNVCVQMHGFSSRVLRAAAVQAPAANRLLAVPVWQASHELATDDAQFAERHVIVCELPNVDAAQLGALELRSEGSVAARYSNYAVTLFERVQSILRNRPQGNVLVQIAVADCDERFAGLSGLLNTASLENPRFAGQIVIVPANLTTDELDLYLRDEERRGAAARAVRYESGVRRVQRWQEVTADAAAPVAFQEEGVYLITGGLGNLGVLFAREILARTRSARVVLTGRAESAQSRIETLFAQDADRVLYRQLDLSDLEQVTRVVRELDRLDGILHSAGLIADAFIVKKSIAELTAVLEPKVAGTFHLDEATRDLALDFFVLFSSLSAMGNPGQADYATANSFMDQFAAWRNAQVAAAQRHGRTRSINWPLWKEGGMTLGAAAQEMLLQTTGVSPMETAGGLDAFYRSLVVPCDRILVAEGDVAKMRRTLLGSAAVEVKTTPAVVAKSAAPKVEVEGLVERTQDYLRQQLSGLLKLSANRIDPHAALETYGIDSVLVMRLTNQLEQTFGSLSKTLFFEYQTIAALAGYFVKSHAATLGQILGESVVAVAEPVAVEKSRPARRRKSRIAGAKAQPQSDVAIVGLAGRYPQAENLQEFWRNLQSGRDCITEIPADRWNHALYFDADPNKAGKTYSKWGGFIADVDKFDPLFFNISPKEAALLDPQERLFLETAWETIEDAGYTRESISGRRVGVFAGVMWSQYELYGAESILRGETAIPVSSHASIANRVSYFFDFHGPSIALDTMCSSSLTAIHLACEELRKGEIEAAIAGGVNVTIHPYKYLNLSQGKFVASDGRCRSFGAGGDGYVPGEGVGAVLLKTVEAALRDGDQIYAVIKSTAVNHGGKTNGYTVPNPNAQGELIAEALRKAKIDPKTLSYVETHGTGTSLGDPIEITGLLKAFEGSGAETQFCPIGSVKSNIGHLESAAGIAAVTKALLQIRNKQLVPSLHAEPINPNIEFESSPFYVQTELAEWQRPATHPRRVGVSSFGAGGSNAHVILEEYDDARVSTGAAQPELFLLSAKNVDALRRYAGRVLRFLENEPGASLSDLAHTSQVGRTAMDARLAILATSVEELQARLQSWLAGGDPLELDDVFQGNAREDRNGAADVIGGKAGKAFLESLLANRELEKMAMLWTAGLSIDWSQLRRNGGAKRVSLPTYPFEKQRHWIKQGTAAIAAPAAAPAHERTYYYPRWTPRALAAGAAVTGPIVVVDAAEELSAALQQRHAAVVRVSPDDLQSVSGLKPHAVIVHESGELHPLFELHRALGNIRFLSLFSDPLAAAVAGFFRTLSMEDPRSRGKAIQVAAGTTIAERAELLWNELSDRDFSTQEIRYGSTRSVRTLVAETRAANGPLPLRQKGVYLLTGGLGGLGLVFAEYLAKQFQARLALVNRSAPSAEQAASVQRLEAHGAEVLCLQGDVAVREDVERVVAETKARFSAIHGVIHSAGVNRDAFIVKKSREQIEAVLAPKVAGTINLDLATADEHLDLFVLFSSVAGALGNVGQSDYAYANRFLDAFAEQRAQQRGGRTLSIDWPLWAEGGMRIADAGVALLEARTGLAPLPTADGIQYWEDFLRGDAAQGIALFGAPARIAAYVAEQPVDVRQTAPAVADATEVVERTESYLKALIGEEIQLAAEQIGSTDPLESFGLDSVMINKINARLEGDLGALPKTLLYEHETVRDLAKFLARESRQALVALFGVSESAAAAPVTVVEPGPVAPAVRANDEESVEEIAIIGVHGYYPESASLDEYWQHLQQGRDLTGVVPAERWNAEELAADGTIYHKWGSFLRDYDKFDPQFFKIADAEAKLIDPQERLFLQSVWAAIEDAGYTRDRLRERFGKAGSADVGAFVGVTSNTYSLWAPEEHRRGNFASPSSMPWSIANRVSYFFDFNGPSLPVDTACSSSLVAVHLACESLRNRDCQVAIAGGVNLYLHPAKYHALCQRGSLSQGGTCRSYGAGDDGFVPGEGIGTLVLKPLRRAVADGDRVYGVIRGSAYDHSGRANGYSAPNPNAQANLIARTLEKAGIHPETISYVEGHGTGTQLGDSLEIAALTQAFRRTTEAKQFCAIGSVKANIGHSESAAGIAGLTKVLLQFAAGQLAPSIHSDEVNPNIELASSPFYLQHGLNEWTASSDHPRRALINSFGAGGVNACVVVEEYRQPVAAESRETGPYLFALSAKNEERLREYAGAMVALLRERPDTDLAALCYTLQSREAMEERLAVVVADAAELVDRLSRWKKLLRGTAGPRRVRRAEKLAKSETRGLNELAARWVKGEEVEWESLYAHTPRRIAASTYPFARERYWVADAVVTESAAPAPAAQLHPLLSSNSSTLKEISFSSTLSDGAFYAVDHKVHEEKVFPGAGFLEMACIAGSIAGEQRVRRIRDVVWIQPLSFRNGPQTLRTVLKSVGDSVEYAISSFDDENESVVHSEGRLAFGNASVQDEGDRPTPAELKAQCARSEQSAAFYEKFAEYGLHYGPAFRSVQEIHLSDTFALAKLTLAESLQSESGQFILHPSIVDGALQTVAGLVGSVQPGTPYLPFALDELEIVKAIPQTCYAYAERAGSNAPSFAGVVKFNIRLLSESGDVLARFDSLYVRPLVTPLAANESSLLTEAAELAAV